MTALPWVPHPRAAREGLALRCIAYCLYLIIWRAISPKTATSKTATYWDASAQRSLLAIWRLIAALSRLNRGAVEMTIDDIIFRLSTRLTHAERGAGQRTKCSDLK
jgi:hypothetical protein